MTSSDNLRGGSTRPHAVAEQDLEQALRETLTHQVAASRSPAADRAGLAIRRAQRTQRRRTLTGVALAAVAVVTVSAGMAQFQTSPARYANPVVMIGDPVGPTTTAPSPPAGPLPGPAFAGVSLIAGAQLVVEGRRTDLGGVGPVDRGVPLAGGGWLLVGTPSAAGRTVWYVAADGAFRVLLAGADAVAVAPDGGRLAWREGGRLFVAAISSGQLLPPLRTTTPESVTPVGFVDDAVLIRVRPDRPGFVLWQPDGGPFLAGTDRSILDVPGRLPDGRLVARVTTGSSSRPCLALLDPARGLAPVTTGCGVPLTADGPASVSPDGRWLLVNGAPDPSSPPEGVALLVDLRTAFGAKPSVRALGPAATGEPAWLDDEAVYPTTGSLVRLRPDRPAEQPTTTTLTDLPAGVRPVLLTRPSL
ncbi:hypothetical protein O7606_15225 [Micromonospora sp. WMMD882]|uniref:hypothetical protein n=1 Tax=Micromonospora sp. WMMD882 TaxID=3015151 RepID=UPI00248B6184|nr:hypothetical protein [Micromonospora sp. WMMD882]WBB77630.1 hypothetical protein O7606_15225 [Micromonospora sp. WMMD882]